jgi:hypothetical protein
MSEWRSQDNLYLDQHVRNCRVATAPPPPFLSVFSLPNRLFFMLASVKKSLLFTLKLLFFTLELLFFTLEKSLAKQDLDM